MDAIVFSFRIVYEEAECDVALRTLYCAKNKVQYFAVSIGAKFSLIYQNYIGLH